MRNRFRTRRSRTLRAALLAVTALAAFAAVQASAYTSPYYPGSKLSLAVHGKPTTKRLTTIVAEGKNSTDLPGGLDLEAFAKRPGLDPTCSKTYTGEVSRSLGNPTESVIYGDPSAEPSVGPFRVPMKVAFRKGHVLVCGYSVYVTDTAASSHVEFKVHKHHH